MNRPAKSANSTTLYTVWGAFLGAIILYGIIAALKISQAGDTAPLLDPEGISLMTILFAAFSLTEVFLAIFFRSDFRKRLEKGFFVEVEDLTPFYLKGCITSWGLINSIAIYGLVLSILANDRLYIIGFAVPAFIILLAMPPQLKAIQEQARRIRERKGIDTSPASE